MRDKGHKTMHVVQIPSFPSPSVAAKTNDEYKLTALRPGEKILFGISEPPLTLLFRPEGEPPIKFSPLLSIVVEFPPNLRRDEDLFESGGTAKEGKLIARGGEYRGETM